MYCTMQIRNVSGVDSMLSRSNVAEANHPVHDLPSGVTGDVSRVKINDGRGIV